MKSCCYFFFISYVSMCYLKVEHKIFHIRVKKKLDTRGRALRIIRMRCFAIEFRFRCEQAGKEKKFCQNKQSQIILILLLLFFFKCWWTRVINTGFLFFNVVEAGEKQQHIYIQTIILLQLLTFFSFMFGSFFDLFFQHYFLVLTN